MNSLTEPRKWEKLFWPLLATALLLALWHYSVVWTATKVFPSPLHVEQGIVELFHKNVLWSDIGSSLRRVAIGFGTAVAASASRWDLTLGWYPAANQVVNPVMQILRPISPIAWIPVAIIFFGVGDNAAHFLIFLAHFSRSWLPASTGYPTFLPRSGEPAATLAFRLRSFLRKVVFPAAFPRSSWVYAWRSALPGWWSLPQKWLRSIRALVYLVIDARNSGKRYDLVVAAMLMIGVIGLILDLASAG